MMFFLHYDIRIVVLPWLFYAEINLIEKLKKYITVEEFQYCLFNINSIHFIF